MKAGRVWGLALVGLAVCALTPRPALAWDNQGHMAAGVITYDDLRRTDPDTLARLLRIAAAHPDRPRLEAGLTGLSGPARDRRLFALLARWPDDIRGTAHDHPEWHYAVRLVPPAGAVAPFTAGQARQAFVRQLSVLANSAAPAGERAVALAWVLHLTGDIHQPLHAGHRLSARFPKTDRAGTLGYVRPGPGGRPKTLHGFWDAVLDTPGPEAVAAEALAGRLAARHPFASVPPTPASASYDRMFRGWIGESYALARTAVYRGPALDESPTPADAPVLTADYVAAARTICERRVAEAGHRGAQVLSRALARPTLVR